MKKVYVVWIHTYNLECLEYCLHTFEERTDYTSQPYRHFIVDSSIGKQAEVKLWIEKENRERLLDPAKPPIECHFCNEHLGPTSKRNIAFSIIKDKCDYILELEDDVTICNYGPSWLKEIIESISELENQGQKVYFDFNMGVNLKEYLCAATLLSCTTRRYIGDYPSQITGQFINLVEEMVLFPRYLKKLLFNDKQLFKVGVPDKIWIEFDLASISSNYVIEFYKTLALSAFNNSLTSGLCSVTTLEEIYRTLYQQFDKDPRPTREVFENTNLKSHECIEKFLRLKNKSHLLLTILEYRKYERSICLIPEEFALFQKEFISNPEILESLISQKAIIEEEGLILVNSKDTGIINLQETLPGAFKVLIKYAK